MTKSEKKIRYALAGAGNIAQVAVLPAFTHASSNSELIAILSGDAEKRRQLKEKYDLELSGDYAELEQVLKDGAVDVLYISTPNALHRSLALRAAKAGVNVLCEKPLATSVADAEEVARAGESAGVKLMTAYRLHFEEATLNAIQLVKAGKIGEPRIFDSVFSHVVRPDDIRMRPDVGGGAIFDLGVYCINAARNLFRAEPTVVFATSQMCDGVDVTTTAVLQFTHGRVAQFTVSNVAAAVSSYRIVGTEGDLRVEPGYEYIDKLEHHLTIDGNTKHESFGRRDQFAPELEYFSRCILQNEEPEPNAEEAIDDLRVVEAVRQSALEGKPVELMPRARARRPTIEQESKKRPVSEEQPVNAPSPTPK